MTTTFPRSPLSHVLSTALPADPNALSLIDVSHRDRLVVKGPGACEFLTRQGIDVPGGIYDVGPLPGGGMVGRTGQSEVFIEDGSESVCSPIASALGYGGNGVYRAPAPTASMLLSGERASDVLLETCNVDLRTPPNSLVLTRVAGVSCIILHRLLGEESPIIGAEGQKSVYQLWFDGTYGHYLGSTLLEIVREHAAA